MNKSNNIVVFVFLILISSFSLFAKKESSSYSIEPTTVRDTFLLHAPSKNLLNWNDWIGTILIEINETSSQYHTMKSLKGITYGVDSKIWKKIDYGEYIPTHFNAVSNILEHRPNIAIEKGIVRIVLGQFELQELLFENNNLVEVRVLILGIDECLISHSYFSTKYSKEPKYNYIQRRVMGDYMHENRYFCTPCGSNMLERTVTRTQITKSYNDFNVTYEVKCPSNYLKKKGRTTFKDEWIGAKTYYYSKKHKSLMIETEWKDCENPPGSCKFQYRYDGKTHEMYPKDHKSGLRYIEYDKSGNITKKESWHEYLAYWEKENERRRREEEKRKKIEAEKKRLKEEGICECELKIDKYTSLDFSYFIYCNNEKVGKADGFIYDKFTNAEYYVIPIGNEIFGSPSYSKYDYGSKEAACKKFAEEYRLPSYCNKIYWKN